MLEGTNKKREWMVVRVVEKFTHYQTSMTFTAELHPKKLQKIYSFITHFKCFIYVRSYTEEHRDTQGTDTQTFLFTTFLVFFYRGFSRKKKLWKKLHSFQHQRNGVGVGMGIFRLSFLKNLS